MTTKMDLTMNQGSKFAKNIQVRNSDQTIMDLTGYSARMMVRETYSSVTPLLSASTIDGRITINAPGGVVMINIGADVTGPLTWNSGIYDVEIFTSSPAEVIRILEGNISLSPEVTY